MYKKSQPHRLYAYDELLAAASQRNKEREYWLNRLAVDLLVTGFPYDYKGKIRDLESFHTLTFTLEGETASKLSALSSGSDQRLHMILIAVLAVLVEKYTGNNDITIGTPVLKQGLYERFINTVLVIRSQTCGDMTFKELLLQIRQRMVEATENQNYPYPVLLDQLNRVTGEEHRSLFDVAVLVENIHDIDYVKHTNPGMLLAFLRKGESIRGKVEYKDHLYEKGTVTRVINHFILLTRQVIFNPDVPLSSFDILPPEEKQQLLEQFNDTAGEYPRSRTVHELFVQQVEKYSRAEAVVFQGKRLSYAELHRQSDQLAWFLRNKGVKHENIVALLFDWSIEMIVAILGVLKSGAAYLPIDLKYPGQRIQYILKDCHAPFVITTAEFTGILGDIPGEVLVYENCGTGGDHTNKRGDVPVLPNVTAPQHLAYIIYTSGSEGKPKGIMMTHDAFVEFTTWAVEEYEHKVGYRVLLSNSYAFDSSLQQIFPPLVSGGTLHLLHPDVRSDAGEYLAYLKEHKINNMDEIPVLMNVLLENFSPEGREEELPDLTCLSLGSEYVPIEVVRKCRRHLNHGGRIINGYGPAEASVETCTYHFDGRSEAEISLIGKPRRNLRVYIMDRHGHCCPLGVLGEICVSGIGLARGYLNKPELTREKFIPNPHSGIPRDILYRTGDQGYWLSDGNIEFQGRIDQQVKIRGYRIELEEIENCLMQHSDINHAVVLVCSHHQGDKFLCAYIVSARMHPVGELRRFLAQKVSDYMIPSYFVRLDRLPLTPNGKVDRKALPEPELEVTKEFAGPRRELEKKLVEIWSGILGIETIKISIDDDFFQLGGHSLKATVMITRIHKVLQVKIPIEEIFTHSTIRELAGYIERVTGEQFNSIEPVEKKEYYPLSSAQKRMFLLHQVKTDNTSDNTPGMTIIEGPLDIGYLNGVIHRLIKRHELLRTSFELVDHLPRQRIHPEADFEIEYRNESASITVVPGTDPVKHEKINEIIDGFVRPFNLKKVPLLRVGLIRIAAQQYILLYDMHHIISDGTSSEIFVSEFIDMYAGGELPPLRIQYKDFACWQDQLSRSGAFKKQEKFWLQVFSRKVPLLHMPVDFPRPSAQSFEGSYIKFIIDKPLTSSLNEIASQGGATLYMVLLAIYNILLFKYTGQEDIVVGSSIAGRQHTDLEKVIGFFVNTLAMRNFPGEEKSFSGFLEEVKNNALKAYTNQDFQFDDLVNRLGWPRDPARHMLFDTHFTLHNIYLENRNSLPEIKNLVFKPYPLEEKTTQFDIIIHSVEVDGEVFFTLRYCTGLFKSETIERMVGYFKDIAQCVAENKHIKIKDINISHHLKMAKTDMPSMDLVF
jgi:amino acid adenylation domain-containing protein